MKSKQVRNSLVLVLTALIWGTAFVAQSAGGDAVGPYTFNAIRSLIGGLMLIPVILFMDSLYPSGKKPQSKREKMTLFVGGLSCGCALFAASTAQQVGIYMGTSAGKAGNGQHCKLRNGGVLQETA